MHRLQHLRSQTLPLSLLAALQSSLAHSAWLPYIELHAVQDCHLAQEEW